jgi:hypothetical protein
MATLKADLREGESIHFSGSGSATITMAYKGGRRVRMFIEADESMRVRFPGRQDFREVIAKGLDQPTHP